MNWPGLILYIFYLFTRQILNITGPIRKPVSACETRWSYRSRQVAAIKADLNAYRDCFDAIGRSRDPNWQETKAQADGFSNKVWDFNFVFWLHSFTEIFKATDFFYKELQDLKMHIGWATPALDRCKNAIKSIRERSDEIFEKVSEDIPDPDSAPRRKRRRNTRLDFYFGAEAGGIELSSKDQYRADLKEVCDTILRCLNDRFGDIEQFRFIALLDVSKFSFYATKEGFPHQLIDFLMSSVYGKFFNREVLTSDLRLVYTRQGMPKHLDDLVRRNRELGFQTEIPEFCRLAELSLTIALTVSSAERSFSALARVKNSLRSTMLDDRLKNISILSAHKKLMENLDDQIIIDKFAEKKERRMDLKLRK